ncbi:MAG: T9SS type A sorting domain-containing protein [Flavobacteriales bacterium]|nr:T9SS type A sorting domain-containing protein [Flavobacteriales bacterium]
MKTSLLFLLSFSIGFLLQAQQVSTIFNSASMQIDDAIIQDVQGNIYGSHYMGSNVYKITPSGTATIFKSGLNTPNGLAFDSQGNLYVADNIGNRVYKLDSAGNTIHFTNITSPSGVIKSINSDTMIITQFSGHGVRKLAPDGTLMPRFLFGFPMNGPVGLAYGADSSLYIGNFTDRKVYRWKYDSLKYIATVPGASNASLGFISEAHGLLYGTNFQSHQVYEINPNYTDSVRLIAGSTAGNTDGQLSVAKFNSPNGIYASKGGDSLLISDFTTGNIRMITGLVTGILQEKQISFNTNVYPNPSTNFLKVQSEELIRSIRIYSMIGKLVYHQEQLNVKSLELEHFLKGGNYLLSIFTDKGIETKKLIVFD